MHYELWWSFVKVQKGMQIADGALAPFWGTASVEIGLHFCTGDFLFLCFARLPDPPCAPSITNEANLFWPTDPCNVQRTNLVKHHIVGYSSEAWSEKNEERELVARAYKPPEGKVRC